MQSFSEFLLEQAVAEHQKRLDLTMAVAMEALGYVKVVDQAPVRIMTDSRLGWAGAPRKVN